jgi:hypothetical protein
MLGQNLTMAGRHDTFVQPFSAIWTRPPNRVAELLLDELAVRGFRCFPVSSYSSPRPNMWPNSWAAVPSPKSW